MPSWKEAATTQLSRSKYFSLLSNLYQRKAGKRAIYRFLKLQIRREVAIYTKEDNALSTKVSQDTLRGFSWREVIAQVEVHLPALFAVLWCGLYSQQIVSTDKEDENKEKTKRKDTRKKGIIENVHYG